MPSTGYLGSCHTQSIANQAMHTDISVQFCFHFLKCTPGRGIAVLQGAFHF